MPQLDTFKADSHISRPNSEVDEEVIELQFCDLKRVEVFDSFRNWDDPPNIKSGWIAYEHATGEQIFLEDSEIRRFIDANVGVSEYFYYNASRSAIDAMCDAMPDYALRDGIRSGLIHKLDEQLSLIRDAKLTKATSLTSEQLHRSQRDLMFALSGFAAAFDYRGDYGISPGGETQVWYRGGRKTRHGYLATYDACSDTYHDVGDQEDLTSQLADNESLYPDTFHYPAQIEIEINPLRRLELRYRPAKESMRRHHYSHIRYQDEDGTVSEYENDSLSIRVDLDPDAPAGVAVDIARSSYDGTRNGRYMQREPDLLGIVLEAASPHGSHAYEGFTPDMATEFPGFAERIVVQLSLQKKEHTVRRQGRVALDNTSTR